MGPDASLTPELIQAQSFTSAFRGFDPGEVRSFLNRVATEVRAWRERAEQLESAWHSAEERAARPPVLDEDTLMAAVGEETASILRSARAAAADMRAKAAEETERQIAEAREEGERLLSSARSEAERLVQETRAEVEKERSDAREQSEKLMDEARSESDRLLSEARSEAERLRTAAEDAAARTAAGAEDAAARLMSGARSEAAEILEKVRGEAEAMRTAAERDRQLTIEGANSTRDRILEDLSRRRRIATVQIEQLRAGRERLIGSYAVVRRTLEEVSAELSRADAEARAAADEVGRRMAEDPEAGLGGLGASGPEPAVALLGDVPAEPDLPAEPAPVEEPTAQEPTAEEPTGESAAPEAATPEVAAAEVAAPQADGAEDTGGSGAAAQEESSGGEDRPGAGAVTVEDGSGQPDPAPEAASTGRPAPDKPVRKAAATTSTKAKRTRNRAKPAEQVTEAAAGEDGEPAGSAVDELFARIRGTRADGDLTQEAGEAGTSPQAGGDGPAEPEGTEHPEGVVHPEGTAEREPAGQPGAADQPEVTGAGAKARPGDEEGGDDEDDEEGESRLSDADESLLQRRESAVVDLEVTLTRRLKRALQDEQNDVLDRLRNLKGEPTVERLLADPAEQVARYRDAARPLLVQAASAGAEFAVSALGPDAGTGAGGPGVDIDDLAGETGSGIVGPLRRRLEQAVERNAGDEQAVLIESLGAAYREWKTQRIERLAGDMLAAAFSRGTWDAVPDGVALRWIVEDTDGPCPDCDDDALAGELPKGEAFPTGQHHPPAHSGCRCLLVPGPAAG